MSPEKYAIIDVGSNTMRLVIYAKDKGGRLRERTNVKSVARLRDDLNEDGKLSEKGVQKLITYLLSFQEVTRFHKLDDVKCVATATIRHAHNQQEILDRVEAETDFKMRVLSDYEEAFYGYLAVVQSTPFEEGITIDIGGGSAELTLFKNRKIVHYHSFSFGALSLKKKFVKGESATREELEAIKTFVAEQFATLPWLENKELPIIAIGGSARNVVQIHQACVGYPLAGVHQYMMSLDELVAVRNHLQPLSFAELQKVDGLSKDRADIIEPAIEVFISLLEAVGTTNFALSRKGLRDGIFYEQFSAENRSSPEVVIEHSFREIEADFEIDTAHANQRVGTALELAIQLQREKYISLTDNDLSLIRQAAFVYNVGEYIDSESDRQHTFYLLANRTIDGLLHKDRILLSLMASFKNKSFFKQNAAAFKNWFTQEELLKARLFGAILCLADSLHITKRNIAVGMSVSSGRDALTIQVMCTAEWAPEQYQAEKQKKHLEKQLKKNIDIEFRYQ